MSNKKQASRTLPLTLLWLLLAVIAGGGLFVLLRDTTPPVVTLTPDGEFLPKSAQMTLKVEDPGSGLKSLEVRWAQDKESGVALTLDLPEHPNATEQTFTLPDNLKDGDLTVTVTAADASVYFLGAAGKTTLTRTYKMDNKPPRITLVSSVHNLTQGGVALVLYSLSEEPAVTGVKVGERFFPGYKLACGLPTDGNYACLFAMPWDTPPAEFHPMIEARDKAGNEAVRGFPYHANAKAFRHDNIPLSDGFMQTKMPEFQDQFTGQSTYLDQFLYVNREIRKANRARLLEIGRDTAPCPLWKGTFGRLPNAAPRAGFADNRNYIYHGELVDNQTHLGMDLASLANAPVPAANAGKVVLAEDVGIYGNCVILDHGLGLQTLYAHLSEIDVAVGDVVEKDAIIGKTGMTGMAGGDHLHYGVLASGIPVNPLEWWDTQWIKNNITSKLENK